VEKGIGPVSKAAPVSSIYPEGHSLRCEVGIWIYIGTNAPLLRPDVAGRFADAEASVFNVAIDAWDVKPGPPKALLPIEPYLERLMQKQYVYEYTAD